MTDILTGTHLAESMAETAEAVAAALDRELPAPEGPPARLYEAMRYGTLGGGKRLRGFLVLSSARLCGARRDQALRVAAAVEMVHAYSLIHDDLPAMDDDDLRRGKPSCHVAFDEATAILAGDALLTLAFEVIARPETHPDPAIRAALVLALAEAAGGAGMVGGQMVDLAAEHSGADAELIAVLERMKTGALIALSCEAGAILAGAGTEVREALRSYGYDIGLAFQVTDDLLDVVGKEADVGKKVGKDAAAGKATFVAALGLEGARAEAQSLIERASRRVAGLGPEAEPLRAFGAYLLARRS